MSLILKVGQTVGLVEGGGVRVQGARFMLKLTKMCTKQSP